MKFIKFSTLCLFFILLNFSFGDFAKAGTDCCTDPTGCTETCTAEGNNWACIDFSGRSDKGSYETKTCKCQGNTNRVCSKPKPTTSGGSVSTSLLQNSETTKYSSGCIASGDCELNDFMVLGVRVTEIILGLVGSLALLAFIYGGFTMLISEGSAEKVKTAKSIIIGAVVGLVIVFTSYLIVDFVLKGTGYTDANTSKSWFTTP